MKLKRPYIARLNEVIITRENETAIIEYKETNVWTTHLTLGKKIHTMSDQDILDSHNNNIQSQLELMKNYKHVAIEVPPGQPQVRFSSSGHWIPRGGVLRCDISYKDGETAILIDDKELTMQEFGELLSVYEGWGMRIIMVPEDEICQSPAIEIKDPDSEKDGSTPISSHFISNTDH
jgi:hypothetical protein